MIVEGTDHPVVVIPDTHGHLATVERMLERLDRRGLLVDHRLVFLGDYVDRGPDPKGLIDLCIDLQRGGHVMLCGNHEYVLAQALFSTDRRDEWVTRWGGNYEVGVVAAYSGGDQHSTTGLVAHERLEMLHAAMPAAHLEFLRNLPWAFESSTVFAVHAGVSDVPWEEQRRVLSESRPDSWRGPSQLFSKTFASNGEARVPGKVLVTGHAARRAAHVSDRRVMLDCGVGDFGGPLCAWVSDTGELIH